MSPHELGVMLLALAVLIGAARLLGEIARRWRQPAVLGELLAGVLLGPTCFGTLLPEAQAFLFPQEGVNAMMLEGISSLAIVLFLLVAGMEVDLSIVWKQGRSALKIGVLGTLLPFLVGLLAAWFVPEAFGRSRDSEHLVFTLFFATAMSISALPVIAKTLMDLDLYRTDFGMVVVSAAIFNDLIGWTVFAVVLGMIGASPSGLSVVWTIVLTLLFGGVMLTAGRRLMHLLLPRIQAFTPGPGAVLGFAITLALLGAACTEFIGIHAIFGSFIVGVALGESSHLKERTRVLIDEFVSFIFAPVFFASIGLRVNFATQFDLPLVLLVLSLACIGKVAGAVAGARWGGWPARDAWAIGFAMNARGAMEIILGLLALKAGIIRPPMFVALVVMAIVTSAFSGPLIRWALRPRKQYLILPRLAPQRFLRNLQSESRKDAIRELVALAAAPSGLNATEIERLAWAREKLAATGIGNGVAIPHARVPGLAEPVIAIGLSDSGIEFDAPDGQPAHILFLLLTPLEDPDAQLNLSSGIARLFRNPDSLPFVLRAGTYREFVEAIRTLEQQADDAE